MPMLMADVSPPQAEFNTHLTSGRRLARSTIWNLMGMAAPTIVAIICIRVLIRSLGTDRFGILSLIWALIGYASLFDFGLGRALTQIIAAKLGAGKDGEVPGLVWTSLSLMLLLGLLGTLVVEVFAPWLSRSAFHIPPALQGETLKSLYVLGASLPLVLGTAGMVGVLAAQQRFGLITALRAPLGIFSYAGPLLVLPFVKSLFPVVVVIVVGRLLGFVLHLLFCLRVMPELRSRIEWQSHVVGPLFRFGGWMTISNIVGPLMVTLDRFLIGTILPVAAVAYYATPSELVTRLAVIPGALMGVVFPAFSTSFIQDPGRTAMLYRRSLKYLFLALFPVVLLTLTFARDGLSVWLGRNFAQNSFQVLQWLLVGALINSLATVPFALLQGIGRPNLTAILHLIELPVYLVMLWRCIETWGIEGAAIAWTVRVALDALALFILAKRFLPGHPGMDLKTALLCLVALGILVFGTLPQGTAAKVIFLSVSALSFLAVAWFGVLSREERTYLWFRRFDHPASIA